MPHVDEVLDSRTQSALVYSLVGVPNGVVAMSFAVPGLVETSTNLASVKFAEGNRIVVTSSQRSSVESAKTYVMQMVESVFALAGADVAHSDGYPGWMPDPQSRLLEVTVDAYKRLFGSEPKVRAIHAGLECGLFLEKYPDLEMVSFGPTLRGVHSPDERLEIATVPKFWKLLCEVPKTKTCVDSGVPAGRNLMPHSDAAPAVCFLFRSDPVLNRLSLLSFVVKSRKDMPKKSLCLLFLLFPPAAAAQHPGDEYYPYAERDERRELLTTDSTIFYRAVQSPSDLYATIPTSICRRSRPAPRVITPLERMSPRADLSLLSAASRWGPKKRCAGLAAAPGEWALPAA